jgi:sec-independent protein translocase protein TatC
MMTDPDDFFSDSRMPLGEHIEVLRRHLLRALLGLAAGIVAGFFVSRPVLALISAPVDRELQAFRTRRLESWQGRLAEGEARAVAANQPRPLPIELPRDQLRQALGVPGPDPGGDKWVRLEARVHPVPAVVALEQARNRLRPPSLSALTVTEPFTVYFKVSLYAGFVLASPWIFFQLWAFVAAGLYPQEKRWVYMTLPLAVGLFLAGVALCQFAALPAGVSYLLSFNEWLDVEPELRLGDWLNFALLMPLVFGACFQTPLVMLVLERIGLTSVELYRRQRRMAFFLLAVIAAVLSPTPDWYNMLLLTVPLWALYEGGIVLCRFFPGRVEELPEPEEIVEGV